MFHLCFVCEGRGKRKNGEPCPLCRQKLRTVQMSALEDFGKMNADSLTVEDPLSFSKFDKGWDLAESVQSDREIRWLAEILLASLVRQVKRQKGFNGAATNTGQFKDARDWVELEKFMNDWNVSVVIAAETAPNVAGSWVSSQKTVYLAEPVNAVRFDSKAGLSAALSDAVRNNSWDTFAKKMDYAYLDTLVHELTHAFDDYRSGGKFKKDTYTADANSKDYWLDQIEINARFAETSQKLQRQKLKLDIGNGFQEYMRQFKTEIKSWNDMPEWVQKRLMGRMFKEYSDLSNEEKDRLLVRESYATLNDAIQRLAKDGETQLPEELIWASADVRLRDDKAYSQNQIHTLGKILGDAARNPAKYEQGEFKWARYLLDTIQAAVKKNPEIRDTIQRYFSFSDDEMDRISSLDAWWESRGEASGDTPKDLTSSSEQTETRKNPSHAYESIPSDSKILAMAEWSGRDIAGRRVFLVQGRYYAWDSRHGDWEVFTLRMRHMGSIREHGEPPYKEPDKRKRLELR